MRDIEIIKKIVPEIDEVIQKRYTLLKFISYNQPIGRRTLSTKLSLKERNVRDEVEILRKQNLLKVDNMGMNITCEGKKVLDELNDIYIYLKGIPKLEEELRDALNIKGVIIAPGNCKESDIITKEMGNITFRALKETLQNGDIIGITGGSTMAKVAEQGVFDNIKRDIVVIPARGGLGKDLNTQSNSIAAKLSEGLGGSYRLLYIPDNLEKEALDYMLKNEEINESINLIENINTLLFGIGRADTMAKRRNLNQEKIDSLLDKGSVAEAFGHFFNIDGEEIWEYKTIGLSLKRFKKIENLIGVAGGEEKAEAIMAISSLNTNMILVTDESAAKRILKIRRNY
ncbi:sugar-binding transcriptional regulator [Tissierella creatinophila]|uniref:Central glycolytic regulator n=1 Tax=Tissierella creatinophila DSM 6911 TaxID=1123403 RepID=A0A1U7M951_TISCR|nr:sugar-binding domain-containing protein [Tissierella creatinophila]OLS03842.1 central glycolytic regulator [Tissierella creatinophila DSM 6911]